jgi:hypothetical protein
MMNPNSWSRLVAHTTQFVVWVNSKEKTPTLLGRQSGPFVLRSVREESHGKPLWRRHFDSSSGSP